jgi:hypothetical protein
LELTDGSDIGTHFHHALDFTVDVVNGGRIDEGIDPLATERCDDFFSGMHLAVLESAPDVAVEALFCPVFVPLIALTSKAFTEGLSELTVGFDDSEIAILNGDIAGYFFEERPVSLPALSELILKHFELGDVG